MIDPMVREIFYFDDYIAEAGMLNVEGHCHLTQPLPKYQQRRYLQRATDLRAAVLDLARRHTYAGDTEVAGDYLDILLDVDATIERLSA